MSSVRRSSIDRHAAERILRGDRDAWRTTGRLGAPRAALAAAVRPDELIGEEAAVAAFRAAAHLTPAASLGSQSMLKSALAKIVTVKVAAVLAAVAVGGTAVAAATGVLPTPLTNDPPPVETTPTREGPDTTPSPSLHGLCVAYAAGADKEAVLANPAFSVLVDAAGGVENIEEFCTTVAENAGDRRAPAATDHPTGPPDGLPTVVPGGVPGTPATGRPPGNPGAVPTVVPTQAGRG